MLDLNLTPSTKIRLSAYALAAAEFTGKWIRTPAGALGAACLVTPLFFWDQPWEALWIVASPVIARRIAIERVPTIKEIVALQEENRQRVLDKRVTYVHLFERDALGNVQASQHERGRVQGIYALSLMAAPIFTSVVMKLVLANMAWADRPAGGFALAGGIATAIFFGLCYLPKFCETCRRVPEVEGPEEMEIVYRNRQWTYEQRGMPRRRSNILKGDEPTAPGAEVFQRVFNQQTGAYEYVRVYEGNPNVVPPAPPAPPPSGEHGDAEQLTLEELRRAGMI